MNKRYIDFVPPKSNTMAASPKTPKSSVSRTQTTHRVIRTNTQPTGRVNFSAHTSQKVELGVIEDLSPKFINTDPPKRPLNSGKSTIPAAQPNNSLKEAKSKKIIGKNPPKSTTNTTKPSRKEAKTTASQNSTSKYKTPKTPFVNLDKITKRPLSKNVYAKKVETPSEIPKGPVTIITKPEKDSRVGLIITIILTIILGAAAGTVAFLLLPK